MKDAAEGGVAVTDLFCVRPPTLQGRSFNDLTREELAPVYGKKPHSEVSLMYT